MWATREHLWIDRVASAWLIRRFIDPQAKFLWLKRVKDCPRRAVGFDFDGAEFSHVDSRVTFEVLLASFGLERDQGWLAWEHWCTTSIWAASRSPKGQDLQPSWKAMTPVLDSLYAGYASATQTH